MNQAERAQQAWQVLIGAAHNRQTLTYDAIGELVGVPRHGLGNYLNLVAAYCRRHGLPPLTVLAVGTHAGRPSEGYVSPSGDEAADREKVYGQNWYGLQPPQVSDFEADAN